MSPWLSIPVSLAAAGAVAGALALASWAPEAVVGTAVGVVVLLPLGYFLGCTLIPGVEEKTCPGCGKDALEPMDPAERYGVRCAACGHEDPDIPTARLGWEPPDRPRR